MLFSIMSFSLTLLVDLFRYCAAVDEMRPLCQRSADDRRASTHRDPPAADAGDDAECRVGLLQRYNTVLLLY